MKRRIIISLLTLLMAASCVTTGGQGKISLTGTGTVAAVPDRAGFDLNFRESGDTTAEARDRVNVLVDRSLAVISGEGIAPENIRTTGISYYQKTRWDDGKEVFLGQEAVQTLSITVDLEEKAANLNRLIDSLAEIDGIGVGGLTFEVSRSSSFREEARRLAFENARMRAEQYAALAGRKLGKVLTLTEQRSSAAPIRYSLMEKAAADGPATQVQTGLNEITVVIEVEFELE